MRVVVQRSKYSKVTINGVINGSIDKGLVLLSSFTHEDDTNVVDKMIDKIVNLRIFEDMDGKMNLSILDIGGSILNISQFTLYADCSKGRRPSFVNAMKGVDATKLYQYMNDKLKSSVHTETGIFGEDMKLEIFNDGPVTIILDSKELF